MVAATEVFCEYCGRRLIAGYIELPQDPVAARQLAEVHGVEDPTCLRFCNETCKRRWGHLKRIAGWENHGSDCMCVECMR